MLSFRPLSGSYISQFKMDKLNGKYFSVSVPYRGATFLNLMYDLHHIHNLQFPSPIGELHFSIIDKYPEAKLLEVSVPYRGATFLNMVFNVVMQKINVSVPYRGATFLNKIKSYLENNGITQFPSPIGELHFSIGVDGFFLSVDGGFRPLSGSYISQYHPRNPMSCLGRIGGLRGKSNFIEMQPFWKVKNSHKSSI